MGSWKKSYFIKKINQSSKRFKKINVKYHTGMTALNSSQSITLDPSILSSYSIGYQKLAYFQQELGYNVKRDMPGLIGPEVKALYAQDAAWLNDEPDKWNR